MSKKIKEFRISRVSWRSTSRLFREAAGLLPKDRLSPDFSGIIHLNPFSSALGDIQAVFQKALFDTRGLVCYVPPDVSTPVVYAKKYFIPEKGFSVVTNRMLPLIISRLSGKGLGYSSLVANFLHELKTHFPMADTERLRDVFLGALAEKAAPDTLSQNLDEVFGIINKLDEFLDSKSLLTEDDAVNSFSPSSRCSVLILEGFYAPIPAEKEVIAKLCAVADNILIAPPEAVYKSGQSDTLCSFIKKSMQKLGISIDQTIVEDDEHMIREEPYFSSADGIEEEIESAARRIKSMFYSDPALQPNSIVIAAADIKTYAPVAERVLFRYGIPAVAAGAGAGKASESFSDMLAMLRSVAQDFPRLPFTRFLSSRYFRNMPQKLSASIQRLSPLSGVISGMDSWIHFIKHGTDTFDPAILDDRDEIENGLRYLFSVMQAIWEKRQAADIKEYSGWLMNILDKLGFDPGDRADEKFFAEALDMLWFCAEALPQQVSLEDFTDMLEHALSKGRQESERSGVRIMDIYEAAGLCPDHLFVCGMTEDKIPSLPDMDYLLPDAVKRSLGLKDMDRHMDIQRSLFDMLISSARSVRLSYPRIEDDNLFLPSPFLYAIPEKKIDLPGIYSEEELQLTQPAIGLVEDIPEIKGLHGIAPSTYRVTDMDAYRSCPRRYFLEKVLKLEPPDIKEYEVAATTIGILSHTIMERLIREPLGSYDAFAERAGRIAEDVLAAMNIDNYWKDICYDAFIGMLPDIYEKENEVRIDGYRRSVLEMNIQGEPIEGLRIKGKIDRFDLLDNEIQIIDYKSGSAKLTCSEAAKGLENLQLFLYAAMLQQKDNIKVKRVGIYSLGNVSVKWCPSKRVPKNTETTDIMQTYIKEALAAAQKVAGQISAGRFPAEPMEEYTCRQCHEAPFCPYINRI